MQQPLRARCADLTLGWLGDFWQYKATLAISPALIKARLGSQPPARPSRFQIGSARGYRLVAISGIPPSNTSRRCCRSAVRARSLHDKGQVPSGVKLMPHKHPEDRVYTVISGIFYIGLGDEFDSDKLGAYPPGSVIVLPGNTSHFHWAKSGEYVTQVTAIGPLGLEYMDPDDDPREENRR